MYIDPLLAAVWEIRGMIPQANSIHPPLHFYLCKRLVPWLACFSYSYNFQPPFNKADVIYANPKKNKEPYKDSLSAELIRS